jgi:hypothetical protein
MSESTAVILAAFIAATAALWIGWLQSRALREQNRIAAFERRLAVFKDAQIALGSVMRDGDADNEALSGMIRAVQASWFLFPAGVTSHLEALYDQMVDLSTSAMMVRSGAQDPDRERHIALKHASLRGLVRELPKLPDFFRPYLHLESTSHPLAWIDDLLDWLTPRP